MSDPLPTTSAAPSHDGPARVREALRHESDDTLGREFEAWERTRLFLGRCAEREARYVAPDGIGAKRIVLFDGIPGAGKTTHLTTLQTIVGLRHLSMARFAEGHEVSQAERRDHQLHTGTLHTTDLAFLDAVLLAPGAHVIIEKFPRTPIEAVGLVAAARRHGWRLDMIHLSFAGDPVAASVRRQLARGPRRGKDICAPEARRRALNHLARGSSGRWMLRELGVPIHELNSDETQSENAARIRRLLGLDHRQLGWDLEPLQELACVSDALGMAAWVGGGAFYRPFWNGRFGPVQLPTDLDVAVDDPSAVAPLLDALRQHHPTRRWSVLCPAERLLQLHGLRTSTVADAKAFTTFTFRSGAARWRHGEIEVAVTPGAEPDLREGVLRLNERLLDALSCDARRALLAGKKDALDRVVANYPGLAVDPATAKRLGGAIATHHPHRIATAWRALKQQVARGDGDRRPAAFCRRAPNARERAIAEEILRFHRESDHLPSAPRRPERATLPPPLEELRRSRSRATAPPPDGHASWLHWFCAHAGDVVFREWFLNQAHHHLPVGGADPYLRSVLSLELFQPRARQPSRAQSPMHQGWPLERHLAASVLELETDALVARFDAEELRFCLRMAMLFHDTGKVAGVASAQRHAAISARLWVRHRPAWFPAPLVGTVRWMIETHDLFGAFGRGLTEKQGHTPGDYAVDLALSSSYFRALDAQAVRKRLSDWGRPLELAAAVNKALWKADIGAISAMRWLLPVAELVEELLLSVPTER